jgi:putative endopeptidase
MCIACLTWMVAGSSLAAEATAAAGAPKVPRFSTSYLDRSVDPSVDFYRFAAGNWVKENPVPSDKARWSGFDELQDRNWKLIRELLEETAAGRIPGKPAKIVGNFYRSAMDTNRIERLRFRPIEKDLAKIGSVRNLEGYFRLLADLQERGVGALFGGGVIPDARNSSVYQLKIGQGGLGLPDRDYYLAEGFAKQRTAYREHVTKMLGLLGDPAEVSAARAGVILELETELAKAGKSRVDLRDPNANYNRLTLSELESRYPHIPWKPFLKASGVGGVKEVNVGQTNFFAALDGLLVSRPLEDWKTYLRWHLLRSTASFLHREVEEANFAFYGTVLSGQPQPEPRWQRSAKGVDGSIGEALGQLYVERHFPAAARVRMAALVADVKAVFRDRLSKLEWMSEATRQKGLVKFDRFTQKIGHPEKFREYAFPVTEGDYLGNIQRASQFESRRQAARLGKAVDRSEWRMTPQTVNAYFSPLQNEIVFPAGILQPPFFDLEADDAINYGAIGVVIGHEITHGYDDSGRQYDADGNLNDWWTEADAKEFQVRSQKLVDQYGAYEPLPGKKVNGRLTLGENIADLGGTSIAYEALQRALARDPSKRKNVDGFTPEQRFFLSLSQLWRTNFREAELMRRLTVDPHSPGMYRAVGPHVNLKEFYDAFGIREGTPMYRPMEQRAKIW